MEIECTDVRFSYGRRAALRGFTATFPPGLVGLLGPNGAGKSTLISILATLRKPQAGAIRVGEIDVTDVAKIRRSLGYLPQKFNVIQAATVTDNIAYAAWANGHNKSAAYQAASTAIQRTGLNEYANVRAQELSGGFRQRLGIACAIAHRPAFLLLDEPTVSIDPVQRVELRQMLVEIAQESLVILSTHMVEDIAQTDSYVVVMQAGRTAFAGTVASLRARGVGVAQAEESELEAGYRLSLKEVQ